MGVLECHQSTPLNKMVELKNLGMQKLAVFLLWREIFITTGKKKDTLRPEKKRYSRLSVGCAVLAITTGKIKRYSCLSVECAVLAITTGKKKDTVVCQTGCAVVFFL